jgi:aspartyl aminopeptidase
MVGAHTDSPGLKLKPLPEAHNKGLFQLGVEVYGGALLNPWFDRDLSLAGRITKGTKNGNVKNHLIDFEKPVAFIPSLAIHLDRDANKNRSINPESDVVPIIAGEEHFKTLEDFLSKHKKPGEKILSTDLFFYDTNKAKIIGAKKEFLVGARLDNQLSCYAAVAGLLEANKSENCMIVLNDHEEVGSTSAAGADGSFLSDVLNRITVDPETKLRGLARSLLISTDNAHGVHPNFSEKHEKNHGPILNKGPAIKHNANQRYATNSETAGFFKKLCLDKNIPVQEFVNRGDMACGSTIGPITASKIGVRTLDVGISTFGMHSIRELAGIKDVFYLSAILRQFFNESKDLGANP